MAYYALIDDIMRDSVITITDDYNLAIELKNRLSGWGEIEIKQFSNNDALLFMKKCYHVVFNEDKSLNMISESRKHFAYRDDGRMFVGVDDLYHCNIVANTEEEAIEIAKKKLEEFD